MLRCCSLPLRDSTDCSSAVCRVAGVAGAGRTINNILSCSFLHIRKSYNKKSYKLWWKVIQQTQIVLTVHCFLTVSTAPDNNPLPPPRHTESWPSRQISHMMCQITPAGISHPGVSTPSHMTYCRLLIGQDTLSLASDWHLATWASLMSSVTSCPGHAPGSQGVPCPVVTLRL